MLSRPDWDDYYMALAEVVGTRSPCLSRHIGSVLVNPSNVIISTGYNGPPADSPDCHDQVCVWPREVRKTRGDLSGCPAVHSEVNAIAQAAKSGARTQGCTLYCYCGVPCKTCLGIIINAGIEEVVCLPEITGVGLFYDKVSKRFVEQGLIKIRVLGQKGYL
jgi:dCMP deaminase